MRVPAQPLPSDPTVRLADTATAFDSVAPTYDGAGGNNALVQIMRAELWRAVTQRVPRGGRLLDLGCGTGIDVAYFTAQGYSVTGIDASNGMVTRTRERLARTNPAANVRVENIGAQELQRLDATGFDGIYSDLGPLNCVPDLNKVARECAVRLKPNGVLVFSVIGRYCPWEMAYYALRGNLAQAKRRLTREMVPVNLADGTVWTRYYSPREFFGYFQNEFELVTYRALNLFLPPPYLIRWYERAPRLMRALQSLDTKTASLPLFRDAGDHFLITLRPRPH